MKTKSGLKRQKQERKIRVSDDLLWGVHPVLEALHNEPERFSEIFIQQDKRGEKIEEIIGLARDKQVKLTFAGAISLTGEGSAQIRHQGIVAKTTEATLVPLEDLLPKMQQRLADGKSCRIIVLDSLQDPHNVGAIIRSALASGAVAVLVTRERTAPLGGTAAKSAAGAMSHIDICQVTNLVNALSEFKKIGFWVYGAVKDDDASSIYDTDLAVPACLVVGSEGKGIRPLVKKQCDVLVSIPMEGDLDSLNSSVAAGVILFETMRQVDLSKK